MNLRKTTSSQLCAAVVSLALYSCAALALNSDVQVSGEAANINVLKAHFKEGDYEYVISVLEETTSKTPEHYNMLISALMNTNLDDAEEVAEAFIATYSDDFRAYHVYANVMGAQASNSIFSALGYAKKAKQSLEKAIEVAPDEVDVYQALMQFHLMAPSIAGGDMEEAEKLVAKIASIDEIEGQFAKAQFYLKDEKVEQASAIYATLSQDDTTTIRASFALGSHYISDKSYQSAFDVLSPLLDASVATVEDIESEQWDDYEEVKSDLLFGKYRIGLVAVLSGEHTEAGITALEQYIDEVNTTNIETAHLPSMNWANLRLAELCLNANDVEKAKSTLALIKGKEDKRFAKILKGLKKRV